jgi:uncharacterized protein
MKLSKTMHFAIIAASILIIGYAAVCLLVFTQQDSLLFPRAAIDHSLHERWQSKHVAIPTSDGTIEGWHLTNTNASNEALILYFGGNAENVIYTAMTTPRLDAKHVLATNYRGYGKSTGEPSEQAMLADALAIYDYAINQLSVRPENIVVMGRSLGSGVAVHLAAYRKVGGLILITPYDSMSAVAQAQFPYLPVRWLLRHKFASDALAPQITEPSLILAGADDSIIPPSHATRLHSLLKRSEMHVLNSVGHNDIETHPQYYEFINAFLKAPKK